MLITGRIRGFEIKERILAPRLCCGRGAFLIKHLSHIPQPYFQALFSRIPKSRKLNDKIPNQLYNNKN